MEVILLTNIRGVGNLGDTVKVSPGYGRNFLVPTGKAIYATEQNLKKFEGRRAELEKMAQEALKSAQEKLQTLTTLGSLTISAKAGEEGKLFGSVGTRDIADALTKAGITIVKSEVILPSGALRQIGEYEIDIEIHSDITAKIKVNIIAEQ